MDLSQAKLDANRANAQHSTGPRTDEGKARSSQNRLTHGFASAHLIVSDDERELFDALHEGLRTELRPTGCLEQTLFAQLLHAAWNLHRIKKMEADLFASGDILNPAFGKSLDLVMRYQRLHTRNYHAARKALADQQTNRLIAERIGHTVVFHESEALPIAANAHKVRTATHAAYEAMRKAARFAGYPDP